MNVIRKATLQDLPRILSLYEELGDEKIDISFDKAKKVFEQIIAMPNQEFLVAECDGKVVGSLSLQIVPNLTHNARPWAIIENMIVDSKYRRQKLGSQLIQTAFKICHEAECYKAQLLSNKKRQEAHNFYRSQGFIESALGFRIYFQ